MNNKKKCKKGLSCGGTCIEKRDKCLKVVGKSKSFRLTKVTYEIQKRARKGLGEDDVKNSYETFKNRLIDREDRYAKDFSIKGKNETFLGRVKLDRNKNTWNVIFQVNESYDIDETISRGNKLAIGRAIKSELAAGISKIKDGSIFAADVYNGDGNGFTRQKAYEAAGFKKSLTDGLMYAKKVNGILEPYEY